MRYIPLTQGKQAIIDDEDFALVDRFRWHLAKRKGGISYASTPIEKDNKKGILLLHRLILGAKDGEYVDHINHNGLDNRKQNLRLCTRSQNMHNTKLSSKNKTGYKGTSWDQSRKKFVASIRINNKSVNLGRFIPLLDAAKAYNKAAIKYHGEFAHLNKI